MVTDEKFPTLHLGSPTKNYFSTGVADFRVKNQYMAKGVRQKKSPNWGGKPGHCSLIYFYSTHLNPKGETKNTPRKRT